MIFLISAICLSIAGIIVLTASGRPAFWRTLSSIPFVVFGLSSPFFFEEGCSSDSNRGAVIVTRDENGVLTSHRVLAWCPTRCVNVPLEFNAELQLKNGIALTATFPVEDSVTFVRALRLDAADHVVSNADAEQAARTALRPLLNGFLEEYEAVLLHRSLWQATDLKTTAIELAQYLSRTVTSGERPISLAALGLKFDSLCCVRIPGAPRNM